MARFVGGPYNGMEIGHELINQHCHPTPIAAGGQNRLFLLMPPRDQWERICRGEITAEEAGAPLQSYERVFTQIGPEFHYDADGSRLNQAMSGQADPAFVEAMENRTQEERLADLLQGRMAQFLAKAHMEVIPPGTLGGGMGFEQTNDISPSYDPATQTLTITGVVRISIRRVHEHPDS